MSTPTLDMIGVGSPLIDVLAYVDDAFLSTVHGAKGGMELVDAAAMADVICQLPEKPTMVPGGSAANTTMGLARLGRACGFVGKLGHDPNGELYRNLFKGAGIDAGRFKVSMETPTGQCLCLVTPDSQRTMRTFLGAAMTLDPAEISPADFDGARHVHLEGYVLFNRLLTVGVLRSAKAAGCRVSLDLASFEVVTANQDVLADLLDEYVDIVFANEDEARTFTGDADPEVGLAALGKLCETAVVNVGVKGSWLTRGGETVHVPANVVKAIDTTGAGDLWAAGFLYGHFSGCDLATCGRMGAITASQVVQVSGAAIPDDRWQLIREQMQLVAC